MAWYKIGNFAALTLALIYAACGGDSGSNASNDDMNSGNASQNGIMNSNASDSWSEPIVSSSSIEKVTYKKYTYTFDTYEDFLAGYYFSGGMKMSANCYLLVPNIAFSNESSCLCNGLSMTAYVNSTNQEFYCEQRYSWRQIQDGDGVTIREDGLAYKTFIDNRDGNTYAMGLVDNKLWMFDNLEFDSGVDHSCRISYGCPRKTSDSACTSTLDHNESIGESGYYGPCYSEKDVYGDGKYSNNTGGICPQGWRLPDTTEVRRAVSQKYLLTQGALAFWTSTYDSEGSFYVSNGMFANREFECHPTNYSANCTYRHDAVVRCIKNDLVW